MSKDLAKNTEIIETVANRLNMPKDKVANVYLFLFDYIEKLTWKRGIVSITFPHLGRMYVKRSHLVREIKRLEAQKKKYQLTRLNKIKLSKLKGKLEGIEDDSVSGTSKLKLHWKKPKLRNPFFTKEKTLEQLENWQNEEEK